MRAIDVDQLPVDQGFDDHVFLLPGSVMMVAAGALFPAYLPKVLLRWGFPQLYTAGQEITPAEHPVQQCVLPKGEGLIEEDRHSFPQMQQLRTRFASQLESLYQRYQQNQVLLTEELLSLSQNISRAVLEFPRHALRFTTFPSQHSPTAIYSLNSTLLNLALAGQRKVPKHRAIVEGCATMLYAIATTERVENEQRPWENKYFRDAVNYFKTQNLHAEIIELVLRHQRGGGDDQILPFSCWYCRQLENMGADSNPHEIVLKMLKKEGHQFDAALQKELLHLLSLYPLGTYVRLNDGLVGMTFAVDPSDPRRPIVQILQDPNQLLAGQPTLVRVAQEFPIVGTLNQQQAAAIPPPYSL